HAQRILPDAKDDVVGRGRRLFHLEEQRRIEEGVQELHRIEPGGVGVERRVIRDVRDRVVVEELNQAERDGDSELRSAALPGSARHGAVRRVVAPQASLVETEAAQADAARIGGPSLCAGRAGAAADEYDQPPAPERYAHGSPRGWW